MILTALDPNDSLEQQNSKLIEIARALVGRLEDGGDPAARAFRDLERSVFLEAQVKTRTAELDRLLKLLNRTNAQLADAIHDANQARGTLTTAIEALREGFALFDAQKRLTMWNSRFCDALPDVPPQLKQGLNFRDFINRLSESASLILPDSMMADDWVSRCLMADDDDQVIFTMVLTGDRHIQVSQRRTRAGGTVIIQTDVSELVRLHRQERARVLNDQERITQATLNHMTEGVCLFDEEARLLFWNRRFGELLPAALDRSAFKCSLATVFKAFSKKEADALTPLMHWAYGPRVGPMTVEMTNDAGHSLKVSARSIPRGFLVSFIDVTAERKALEVVSAANELLEQRVFDRTVDLEKALANAEKADAMKTRFTAAASHDLQQPLSAAKLYLAAAQDEADPDMCRRAVEKAQQALGSIETILDALLDISRLDTHAPTVSLQTIVLSEVLSRLEDDLQPLAEQKGLALTVAPSSVLVRSDPMYLRRILQNLIGNAIKYTDRGRVLVGVRRRLQMADICVIDTGPGIAPDQRESIFKEFVRLRECASGSSGMGLGLSIVERACALLDHPLRVDSVVGQGSSFTVSVPLVLPSEEDDAA